MSVARMVVDAGEDPRCARRELPGHPNPSALTQWLLVGAARRAQSAGSRPYAPVMISWDGRSRTIVVGDRAIRASTVVAAHDRWTATVPLDNGAFITVTADSSQAENAKVQLWADNDKGVGMAVVPRSDVPASLARIPICSCGVRDCAHSGRQLRVRPTSEQLLELIDRLEGLVVSGTLADNQAIWQPNYLPNQL